MEIDIRINAERREPRIIIEAAAADEEVQSIVARLESGNEALIVGFRDGTAQILEPMQIIRIYTSGRNVEAQTESGTFSLRMRLYEAENRLPGTFFVRISNAEIVNLRKVKCFDLTKTGVVRVILMNGESTFVSRRFVPRIRRLLGM